MAGIRLTPEEPELPQGTPPRPQLHPGAAAAAAGGGLEMASDDERSVAADSWSVRSEYGSTLDDDQRYTDAADVLAAAAASASFPSAASDYCSDKDDQDPGEVEGSMLGLQSYWDSSYSEDLANFQEHGHAGEIWFGADVMDTVAVWTKKLCTNIIQGGTPAGNDNIKCEVDEKQICSYPVLDLGTGNGLLLQALAKQGFSDLTGTDYSEGAIELARNLAARDGFTIKFLVDDILETKLDRKFKIITDKGTLDAIGLHPDGCAKRVIYWESVSNLVEHGGLVVITSCNHTKDELMQEAEDFSKIKSGKEDVDESAGDARQIFRYIDHVQTYPTIMFGGVEGSQVCTVAFQRV